LLILEKFSHVLAANLLADTGMKYFNLTIIKGAANDLDGITTRAQFIVQTPQELRTFRRQSKRDRCLCHVERSKTSLIVGILNTSEEII